MAKAYYHPHERLITNSSRLMTRQAMAPQRTQELEVNRLLDQCQKTLSQTETPSPLPSTRFPPFSITECAKPYQPIDLQIRLLLE